MVCTTYRHNTDILNTFANPIFPSNSRRQEVRKVIKILCLLQMYFFLLLDAQNQQVQRTNNYVNFQNVFFSTPLKNALCATSDIQFQQQSPKLGKVLHNIGHCVCRVTKALRQSTKARASVKHCLKTLPLS